MLRSLWARRPVMFWSRPGEICPEGCWVIFANSRMFIGDSRLGCIWEALRFLFDERYLVG